MFLIPLSHCLHFYNKCAVPVISHHYFSDTSSNATPLLKLILHCNPLKYLFFPSLSQCQRTTPACFICSVPSLTHFLWQRRLLALPSAGPCSVTYPPTQLPYNPATPATGLSPATSVIHPAYCSPRKKLGVLGWAGGDMPQIWGLRSAPDLRRGCRAGPGLLRPLAVQVQA